MPVQVMSPDGVTVWATALDDSWYLASVEPQPALDVWVEGCWCSRFKEPPVYEIAPVKLVRRVGREDTTIWWHSRSGELLFRPDFWRPEQTPAPDVEDSA